MSKGGLFAFLGGIAAGAVTALLMAPKTGKETREQVKKYLENAEDLIKKNTDLFVEEGKKQIDKLMSMSGLKKDEEDAKPASKTPPKK